MPLVHFNQTWLENIFLVYLHYHIVILGWRGDMPVTFESLVPLWLSIFHVRILLDKGRSSQSGTEMALKFAATCQHACKSQHRSLHQYTIACMSACTLRSALGSTYSCDFVPKVGSHDSFGESWPMLMACQNRLKCMWNVVI